MKGPGNTTGEAAEGRSPRTENLLVRSGRPEDAESASSLAARAKASVGYAPEWLALWRDALTIRPEYLAEHLSFVAMHGEDLVGICVLETRGQEASLGHLWVAPEVQRQGIGRTLVRQALAQAARAGLRRIEVEAEPSAMAFYLRLGARSCGHRPAPMPGAPERVMPVLEFSMSHYSIRQALSADSDTLIAFTLQEAREAEGLELDPEAVARGVRSAFEEPPAAAYWVAETSDGAIVASTSVVTEWSDFHGRQYWWVQSLFIAPEHRGRGLVDLLLNHLVAEAEASGALDLRLYAHSSNARAVRAYQRCGFRVAPYVIMRRQLRPVTSLDGARS